MWFTSLWPVTAIQHPGPIKGYQLQRLQHFTILKYSINIFLVNVDLTKLVSEFQEAATAGKMTSVMSAKTHVYEINSWRITENVEFIVYIVISRYQT